MARLENLGKVIETDVLVIGGGISGMWAAYKAKEFVERVTIVDKGPRDGGGLAHVAGGDFDAVLPGENADDFVNDFVYLHDGLCEQDITEEIFRQSFDRLKDYQKLGCEFLTGPDGRLKGILQRGLDHVKLYPSKLKGAGGADMVRGMIKEMNRLGIERHVRTLVTNLLKYNGRVVGAVGFNTLSGEFLIFKVCALVLATGEGGWKPSYSFNMATGEGTHMAFRAGVELRNCVRPGTGVAGLESVSEDLWWNRARIGVCPIFAKVGGPVAVEVAPWTLGQIGEK